MESEGEIENERKEKKKKQKKNNNKKNIIEKTPKNLKIQQRISNNIHLGKTVSSFASIGDSKAIDRKLLIS